MSPFPEPTCILLSVRWFAPGKAAGFHRLMGAQSHTFWFLGLLDKLDSYDYGLVTWPPSSLMFLTRHGAWEFRASASMCITSREWRRTFLDAPTSSPTILKEINFPVITENMLKLAMAWSLGAVTRYLTSMKIAGNPAPCGEFVDALTLFTVEDPHRFTVKSGGTRPDLRLKSRMSAGGNIPSFRATFRGQNGGTNVFILNDFGFPAFFAVESGVVLPRLKVALSFEFRIFVVSSDMFGKCATLGLGQGLGRFIRNFGKSRGGRWRIVKYYFKGLFQKASEMG
ncbi:hypothetical protein B0H13DRAFT_1870932 [Mycena leptocephala]|nr:hypothetical protein B0H13DRAFT_1870932 [Mycena leptocephala]